MAEFDQVNVLVVDPDAKVREGVETVLREAGFSNLGLGATLDDITDGVGDPTDTEQRRVTESLEDILEREIAGSMVEVVTEGNSVVIRFPGRAAFPSGTAELTDAFLPIVDKIGHSLSQVTGQVVVAGHTDDTPIATRTFRSNWDLSSARAVRSSINSSPRERSRRTASRPRGLPTADPWWPTIRPRTEARTDASKSSC